MPGEEEEGLAYEGLSLAAPDHRVHSASPDMTLIYRASNALSGDEEEDISVSRGFDATGVADIGFGDDSEENPAPYPFEAPSETPDTSLPEPLVVVGTEDAFFFAACVAEEAARGCAAVARGVVAAVLSAAAGNATRESIAAAVLANRTGAPLVSHDVGNALAHVFRAWDIFAVMRAGFAGTALEHVALADTLRASRGDDFARRVVDACGVEFNIGSKIDAAVSSHPRDDRRLVFRVFWAFASANVVCDARRVGGTIGHMARTALLKRAVAAGLSSAALHALVTFVLGEEEIHSSSPGASPVTAWFCAQVAAAAGTPDGAGPFQAALAPSLRAHGTTAHHVAIASAVVDSFDVQPDAVGVLCDHITAAVNHLASDYAAARSFASSSSALARRSPALATEDSRSVRNVYILSRSIELLNSTFSNP
jgi:hypothetical protein